MGDLITELFSAFTETITGLSTGIKDAFLSILWTDPDAASPVLSDFAKFGFIMMGFGVALSLVYGAFRLFRR